jgi:hypothetical protein
MHTYFFYAGALLIAIALNLWVWNPKLPNEVRHDLD